MTTTTPTTTPDRQELAARELADARKTLAGAEAAHTDVHGRLVPAIAAIAAVTSALQDIDPDDSRSLEAAIAARNVARGRGEVLQAHEARARQALEAARERVAGAELEVEEAAIAADLAAAGAEDDALGQDLAAFRKIVDERAARIRERLERANVRAARLHEADAKRRAAADGGSSVNARFAPHTARFMSVNGAGFGFFGRSDL